MASPNTPEDAEKRRQEYARWWREKFSDRDAATCLAVWAFQERRDDGPLVALVRKGHGALMEDPEARDLIARVMTGEPKGRGRVRSEAAIYRDQDICMAVAWLARIGYGIRTEPAYGAKKSACDLVGERVRHLTGDAIYRIWKAAPYKPQAQDDQFMPWRGRTPTAEEIIDYYLCGK